MWRIQAYDREGREIARLDIAGGEVTIGRELDRRLILSSPSVSRRHARILLDGPQPCVIDEGSANGVRVNGSRINGPTLIPVGVRLEIAEFQIDVHRETPAARPPRQAAASDVTIAPTLNAGGAVPEFALLAASGTYAGKAYPIKTGLTRVGRALDNDLVFDDPSVSRRHSRLRRSGAHIEVEDLGSSNGTWLNGRRVETAAPVRPGDLIRFGELEMRVGGEGANPAPLAPDGADGAWPEAPLVEPRRIPLPVLYAGIGALAVLAGSLLVLALRGSHSASTSGTDHVDTPAQAEAQAAPHLKAARDKLEAHDFPGAEKELDQILQQDPTNADARRLRALAASEPQNEQLARQVKAKIAVATGRPDLEAALKLYAQISDESVFHENTSTRLGARLVTFGRDQCQKKRFADCGWAFCRATEVVPASQRTTVLPPDVDAALRTIEHRLAKDPTYTPCAHP